MKSINPYNGDFIAEYEEYTETQVNQIIDLNVEAWKEWKHTSFEHRSKLMHKAAEVLRLQKEKLAVLVTSEMGKRIIEARAEIEKCAWVCDFYADQAASMLADEPIETDGQKSMAIFQPIGSVLAIMPWNYPYWQVFRFAAPALMAGNVGLLKHASNTQGCALAIEEIFIEAGFPENVFRTLVISSKKVEPVIANQNVRAVTLTGSEWAGSQVAMAAGKYLKKSVLELGGSDPCIVLSDADLDQAVKVGVQSRMLTTGQTCISAKRFIIVEEIANTFIEKMKAEMQRYIEGDPMDEQTTLAPLAKRKFVDDIHKQVVASVKMGAKIILGGKPDNNCFYPATIVTNVTRNMPVFKEETFGPVATVIIVKDEHEAIEVANDSMFGLGAALWTNDLEKAESLSRQIEAGAIFVNGLVKSDPRLPFGGIKNSGYGRELSSYGIKEFCNIKSIWVK